ncbi:hypothetical protein [Actinoplanes sp. L3-i22]|uniref:hypothetical protein n=1 Tax=Actinoplanes sp. L3-i22 TaxID=2836373 RepID=UPI001C844D81|nr:hypothetical protein [Actinoplanes sp. L3-i22]
MLAIIWVWWPGGRTGDDFRSVGAVVKFLVVPLMEIRLVEAVVSVVILWAIGRKCAPRRFRGRSLRLSALLWLPFEVIFVQANEYSLVWLVAAIACGFLVRQPEPDYLGPRKPRKGCGRGGEEALQGPGRPRGRAGSR